MLKIRNPFTPTFGIVPPYLAGRDLLLDTLGASFDNGLGDPNLCTLLIGPRGSGKTALLSCVGGEARERGWIVVDSVAETGMLEDILQHAQHEAAHLVEPEPRRTLSGVNVGELIGLQWEIAGEHTPNWRMRMEALLRELSARKVGLLITVDEVRVDVEEMVSLASSYQLFVRSGFDVALLMAGLPANVTDLVEDRRVSFLRRARQHVLGPIGAVDVSRAFRKTIERAGRHIDEDALSVAVEASQGFPYMIQLVGYHMWIECDGDAITKEDALLGVRAAEEDFKTSILDRTWSEMSQGDRNFALAMLHDEQASSLTSVARRIGKGTNYASTYKRRLMKQGVIGSRPGNTFDFDIPLMRDYLRSL